MPDRPSEESGRRFSDQGGSGQRNSGQDDPGPSASDPAPGPSASGRAGTSDSRRGVSRRALFGLAGAGVVMGAAGGAAVGRATAPDGSGTAGTVPFRGAHQAGIVTPAQDRMHFVAFDVITDSREELVSLLRTWTSMADRMSRGLQATPDGAVGGNEYAPPEDTGEALGLDPSQLTITIGFGPSLFVGAPGTPAEGADRFGIADRKPSALEQMPKFMRDELDPARSGGDLCIQACANDPQVAVHAVRNLAREGFGVVAVRWSQLGFGRTSSTSTGQETPRNLFGFKDGTRNVKAEDTDAVDRFIWVDGADDQAWMAGGSYLVARKISMHIEPWDRTTLHEQERVFGREKGSGAPLGQDGEFDELDLQATGPHGLVIDEDAHVRLASAEKNGGIRILRRGYNFTEGSDGLGHLDAGLFFIAYCRDPKKQFVPLQDALSRNDLLNEYITHVGSAVFAVPPGVRGGDDFWGAALFA